MRSNQLINYTTKFVDRLDGYYAVLGPDGEELSGIRIAQLLNEHDAALRAARVEGLKDALSMGTFVGIEKLINAEK